MHVRVLPVSRATGGQIWLSVHQRQLGQVDLTSQTSCFDAVNKLCGGSQPWDTNHWTHTIDDVFEINKATTHGIELKRTMVGRGGLCGSKLACKTSQVWLLACLFARLLVIACCV